jgi:hypothetical protein
VLSWGYFKGKTGKFKIKKEYLTLRRREEIKQEKRTAEYRTEQYRISK